MKKKHQLKETYFLSHLFFKIAGHLSWLLPVVNVIKLFICAPDLSKISQGVVPCKFFHGSITFVRSQRTCLRVGHPKVLHWIKFTAIPANIIALLKLTKDKRTGLFILVVNDVEKKFYKIITSYYSCFNSSLYPWLWNDWRRKKDTKNPSKVFWCKTLQKNCYRFFEKKLFSSMKMRLDINKNIFRKKSILFDLGSKHDTTTFIVTTLNRRTPSITDCHC